MIMKKKYIIISVMACLAIGLGYKTFLKGDVFSDIGHFFKSAEKKVAGAFEDAISALKRVPACAEVVGKGTEWAAMQGAYYTAVGTLEIAKTLQQTDPRIVALQSEIVSLEAAKKGIDATIATASTGVDIVAAAGEFGVEAISTLGDVVGKLLVSGFNLKKLEFSINVAEVKKGKLPMVLISGVFAGKTINDLKLQIDFKDIKKSLLSLAGALKKIIL